MGRLTVGEIAEMMGGTIIEDGDPCLSIADYSYSSKEGDSETLFLPIVGERVDAHNFIADARKHGMIATTTERGHVEEDTEGMTYIAVDNTKDAIQRLGERFRRCFNIPAIGITGSVGKTSTKEMIASALSGSFSTIKTEGNKNGQLGVPLMVLKTDEDTECLVLEMGVSLIGEMERLSRIARPTVAVVTNIGMSHIGNFGCKENTRREKLAIINEMDENGILLLNGDDEMLAEIAPGSPCQKDILEVELYDKTREVMGGIKRLSYGLSPWCDYYADNIVVTESGTEFDFCTKDTETHIKLNVFGNHNVLNAVASMACASILNADESKALQGLCEYKPIAMRGTIELLDNGVYIIDDSYNASPDSMRSGLEVLMKVDNPGKNIAVLADMLELGDYSEECHRTVGQHCIKAGIDVLVAVGHEAKFMADEVMDCDEIEVVSVETKEEALEYLQENVNSGDALLFKGSRGMGLDKLAEAIRKAAEEE